MATRHNQDLLHGLPRTRPARRSEKRPPMPAVGRPAPAVSAPAPRDPVVVAVRTAAELAEAGMGLGARVLRGVVERLPAR